MQSKQSDDLLSVDLDLDFSQPAPPTVNLMDEINALLAELEPNPSSEVQERVDVSDYYDYQRPNDYTDEKGHIQVHASIAMPDNCILVSHDRSPGLLVSILKNLVRYYQAPKDCVVSGPICVEHDGEFIASDEHVAYNADLLSTLLNLNETLSQDVVVRLKGVNYSVWEPRLLSKFLCT